MGTGTRAHNIAMEYHVGVTKQTAHVDRTRKTWGDKRTIERKHVKEEVAALKQPVDLSNGFSQWLGVKMVKALIIEHAKDITKTVIPCFNTWPVDLILLYAADGMKAAELIRSESPNLILLDLDLPTSNAFEMLSNIRLLSNAPIIALSEQFDEIHRLKTLEIGADGFISKPINSNEFLAKVTALMRRANIFEQNTADFFISNGLTINFLSREVSLYGNLVKLTPIEYDLLTYLVKNEGRVILRSTIMEKVWGPEYANDHPILKKYIHRLRQKLKDDGSNPQMLISERGVGYKFVRPKN